NTSFPATFTAQTNWIVANRGALNIAFVSHLGDVVEHLDAQPVEWTRADTSMRVLDDNGVPYGVAPGNHDQSATGVAAYFDLTFPVTQFRADGLSAEAVWQQIVKPNCNVFMVVNGHYPGEGRRTDLNDCGKPVHQVLMDYQSRANGGDGWLRYFRFKPSQNKISAFTYSVTRNEFEADADSQFDLDYKMEGKPFTVNGKQPGIPSGPSSVPWAGLEAGADYDG